MAFDTEINDYAGMAQDEYGDSVVPYREAATAALESLNKDDDPTLRTHPWLFPNTVKQTFENPQYVRC